MGMLLLIVGDHDPEPLRSVLNGVTTVTVPARPERAELNAALDRLGTDRLVVAADDAGLGEVVRRLMRLDRLGSTEIAVLPMAGPGRVRARAGLPADLTAAAAVARDGRPVGQGLVRDDHGGVALGQASLLPTTGETLGMRAYVDEHELVDARVTGLTVTPRPDGLSAAVEVPRRLRRTDHRERTGRAVTVSCEEARLVSDGVERGSLQSRCTWWFEPDRWHLVLPT
ncbi:MAG TPA: hypothetical protein VHX59_03585 [Mycobacteriales bacterium]|nr:hypothetical protein [Mycobacteriales bacterium]